MGRIEGIISDELEAQLRIEVVKRYGGRKGDLVKGLSDAIQMWVNAPIVEAATEIAMNEKQSEPVQSKALDSLATMGYPAVPSLMKIANKPELSGAIREKALDIAMSIMSPKPKYVPHYTAVKHQATASDSGSSES